MGIKTGPRCTECPLYNEPGPVGGDGSKSSKLVFLGMNPAESEISENRPFAGTAGGTYSKSLADCGIARSEVYTTNIVKCRTPGNAEPNQAATDCCRPILDEELGSLTSDKQIFILMGDYALRTQIHESSVGKWRGYVETRKGRNYIPTYHPSGVNRSGGLLTPYFEADIRKAWRLGKDGGEVERVVLSPSDAEVVSYTEKCARVGQFALDIETPTDIIDDETDIYLTADSPTEINMLSLSAEAGEGILLMPEQLPLLRPLLARKDITCFGFNIIAFDHFCVSTHMPFENRIFDLMLALYALYPQARPKNLAAAASIFSNGARWKPEKRGWRRPEQNEELYCVRDSINTFTGSIEALKQLRITGQETLFWNNITQLAWAVREWQRIGIRGDMPVAQRKELQARMLLDTYGELWSQLFPATEWTSPKQLCELFYGVMKLPPQYNVKKTKEKGRVQSLTTDDEALTRLGSLCPDKSEVFKIVQALRGGAQDLEFIGRIGADGKAHPKTLVHRSESGRLAQIDPNMLNIPEEMRDIFLPDCPNCVWLHIDYSQSELWDMAYYCNCKSLLRTKERGEYIHGKTYEDVFGKPFFKPGLPKTKANRLGTHTAQDLLLAKRFPLGVNYGLSANAIAAVYGWSVDTARVYLRNYLSDKPEIPQEIHRVETQLYRGGILRNAFGRIRRFSYAERNEALSFKPQSTTLDVVISKAIVPLPSILHDFHCDCGSKHFARVMFAVHDSVEINSPRKWLKEVAAIASHSMSSPIPEMNGFTHPCEAAWGENWKEASEGIHILE